MRVAIPNSKRPIDGAPQVRLVLQKEDTDGHSVQKALLWRLAQREPASSRLCVGSAPAAEPVPLARNWGKVSSRCAGVRPAGTGLAREGSMTLEKAPPVLTEGPSFR